MENLKSLEGQAVTFEAERRLRADIESAKVAAFEIGTVLDTCFSKVATQSPPSDVDAQIEGESKGGSGNLAPLSPNSSKTVVTDAEPIRHNGGHSSIGDSKVFGLQRKVRRAVARHRLGFPLTSREVILGIKVRGCIKYFSLDNANTKIAVSSDTSQSRSSPLLRDAAPDNVRTYEGVSITVHSHSVDDSDSSRPMRQNLPIKDAAEGSDDDVNRIVPANGGLELDSRNQSVQIDCARSGLPPVEGPIFDFDNDDIPGPAPRVISQVPSRT